MYSFKLLWGLIYVGLSHAALKKDEFLVVGQTFIINSPDPTSGSNPWALTTHGVSEKLFTVDEEGEIVGQLGISASRINDNVWEITLKDDVKFSDSTPLDATHVADALNMQNQKNDGAKASLGEITASAPAPKTVRIETEKATHIMPSVLAEWPFVIYMIDSDGNFVYTGPYTIDHFEDNDHMDLKPNEYYPGSEERPFIEVKKFASGQDLAEGVEKGDVDLGFHLPIDQLPKLREIDGLRIRSFEVGYHYMAFYNVDSLPDVRVRQAIDKAIDRTVLSQALSGGHPTRSLFPDNSPYYTDDSDAHGAPSESAALLEEAGWTLDGGKRKNAAGEELKVHLVAYPHRPGLGIMQPHIAKSLEDLGISVKTTMTGMDWSETSKIMEDRSFDMLMWAQHTLPAGDPGWFLNSFFHSGGGNNHANYASDIVDSRLDDLQRTEDHQTRVFLSNAIQAQIHEDVPVSNLVTPLWHVSSNDNVKEYVAYGSDYYIIRSDLRANYEDESSSATLSTKNIGFVSAVIGSLYLLW